MPLRIPCSSRPPSRPIRSSGRWIQPKTTACARLRRTTTSTSAAAPDDEDDVDQLAANRRAATLDAHRHLEPCAQRRHHPGGGPAEDEQADEAEGRRRRRQLLDLARDVRAAGLGERQRVDDLVDHVVAEAVVAEHEPEDRDEDDRERDEGEEDAVGDARGVLAAAVGEVAVDRLRDHAGERAQQLDGPAGEPERPRRRAVRAPGVVHHPSLGALPRQQRPLRVHFRPLPSPVAQLAEHSAVNRRVVGSSPTRGASRDRKRAGTPTGGRLSAGRAPIGEAMPAHPWLVHFPDSQSTVLESRRVLPETGEELISGWVVTDRKVTKREHVEIWVTAKTRRKTIRQRTDRH